MIRQNLPDPLSRSVTKGLQGLKICFFRRRAYDHMLCNFLSGSITSDEDLLSPEPSSCFKGLILQQRNSVMYWIRVTSFFFLHKQKYSWEKYDGYHMWIKFVLRFAFFFSARPRDSSNYWIRITINRYMHNKPEQNHIWRLPLSWGLAKYMILLWLTIHISSYSNPYSVVTAVTKKNAKRKINLIDRDITWLRFQASKDCSLFEGPLKCMSGA